MVEQGWIASEVTQEHLQNLVSQGYMMAASSRPVVCPRIPDLPCQWGIRRGLCGVLQARVRRAITHISLLFTVVLWPRTASLDPLEGLTHSGLCDPM
jgi:hypothetical protein